MKDILIVNKGKLEHVPPTVTLAKTLADMKIPVKIICTSCYIDLKNELELKNIEVIEIDYNVVLKGKISKIEDWSKFKSRAWKLINTMKTEETMLWITTGDTAICLGKKLLGQKYYLTLLELYDKIPTYKKMLEKFAFNAVKVITPELCRANIIKVWWNLDKTPIVMPNKPYIKGLKTEALKVDVDEEIMKVLEDKNKKIILYQGHINKDRDLKNIANALTKINDDKYVLVLMGTNYGDTVTYLKSLYKYVIHIDFIKSPNYFKITEKAFIGITTYDDSSLNHIFCAPNKIFEYTYFGVPILARDIPGLKYTIGINEAGVCVDTDSIDDIAEGILEIEKKYELYRENAYKYFESIDLTEIVNEVLS